MISKLNTASYWWIFIYSEFHFKKHSSINETLLHTAPLWVFPSEGDGGGDGGEGGSPLPPAENLLIPPPPPQLEKSSQTTKFLFPSPSPPKVNSTPH